MWQKEGDDSEMLETLTPGKVKYLNVLNNNLTLVYWAFPDKLP